MAVGENALANFFAMARNLPCSDVMENDKSLYGRISGEKAIESLVDEFYERVLADEVLAPSPEHADTASSRLCRRSFLVRHLVGRCSTQVAPCVRFMLVRASKISPRIVHGTSYGYTGRASGSTFFEPFGYRLRLQPDCARGR